MSDNGSPPRHRQTIHGRGTAANPKNRFERLAVEPEAVEFEEERDAPETHYLRTSSKGILTKNDSPDVGFAYSVNPYSGCSHGCVYCYARPYHEYWGFSAGLDFETRILVKEEAPALLRQALMGKKYVPDTIAMSGVTDCYQPGERELKLTRGCLQVLAEFKNPVGMITKNRLVTRDADVLAEMARWGGSAVFLSITTLDPEISAQMEPRASRPSARLEAIRTLADAGVPVGVNAAPLVPGLTDHELPAILDASAAAGATFAGYGVVRLPGAVEGLFEQWLQEKYPNSFNKVMSRIRETHEGRASDSRFGVRMRGTGKHAEQIAAMFQLACRKSGLNRASPNLSIEHFRRPGPAQADLFE